MLRRCYGNSEEALKNTGLSIILVETFRIMAFALLCLGSISLVVVAVWFDPQPISVVQAPQYKDKAVVIIGNASVTHTNESYVRGIITATCQIPFTHFTANPPDFVPNTKFIGVIQEYKGQYSLLVEEIK